MPAQHDARYSATTFNGDPVLVDTSKVQFNPTIFSSLPVNDANNHRVNGYTNVSYYGSFWYGLLPQDTYEIRDGRQYYSLGCPFSMPSFAADFFNVAAVIYAVDVNMVTSIYEGLKSYLNIEMEDGEAEKGEEGEDDGPEIDLYGYNPISPELQTIEIVAIEAASDYEMAVLLWRFKDEWQGAQTKKARAGTLKVSAVNRFLLGSALNKLHQLCEKRIDQVHCPQAARSEPLNHRINLTIVDGANTDAANATTKAKDTVTVASAI